MVFDRDFFSLNEFLGRTELNVGDDIAACEERRGSVTRTLKLLEAESAVIKVKTGYSDVLTKFLYAEYCAIEIETYLFCTIC